MSLLRELKRRNAYRTPVFRAAAGWLLVQSPLAELIAQDSDSMDCQIAQVYAWRGEVDSAFEWLQHGFDTHDPGTLGMLTDPLLRGLRSDPRFAVMLRRLGLSLPAPTQ